MCLLAQINPLKPPVQHSRDDDEIHTVQLHHAHQVCGIVAHTKDHGVASVAIRSLAIAGSVLTEPREQYEVLDLLTRIYERTGWNLKRVENELKRAWGWIPPEPLGMGGSSGPGSAAGLANHHPGPTHPAPIRPASRGGTFGAAAVLNQLFRPHDPPISSATSAGTTTTTTAPATTTSSSTATTTPTTTAPTKITNYLPDPSRRTSQPAPLPLPSVDAARRPSALRTLSGTGGGSSGLYTTQQQQPPYSASTVASSSAARRTSTTTASPSAQASPTATTTAHTPASVSSMAGNAAGTPPAAAGSGSGSGSHNHNHGYHSHSHSHAHHHHSHHSHSHHPHHQPQPHHNSSTTNSHSHSSGGGGGTTITGTSSHNRPMVNPLLAQADFNQPNHPYREWYKPPDRTAHSNSGSFGSGGLWPY